MHESLVICMLLVLAICTSSYADRIAWPEDHECFRDQTVYFESGKSALNAEAERKVAEVAK